MTARIVVAGGAVAFGGFGLVFLLVPSTVGGIGLVPTAASGTTDVRAIMGGVEVGIGLYLMWCVREGHLRSGAVLMSATFAFMVVGRLIGMLVDGGVVPLTLLLTAAEGGGLVAALWAFRRS